MKDIFLVISLLLAVGLSVVVVRFAEKADKAGKSLDEERYSRMVAEETLQKKASELMNLHDQLKGDQDKMGKIEDILDEQKGINSDLKKQYDALVQAKSDLEEKLQQVLQEKAVAQAAVQAQAKEASSAPAVVPVAQGVVQTAVTGH